MNCMENMIPLALRKHTIIGRRVETLGIVIQLTPANEVKCGVQLQRFCSKGIHHSDSNIPFVTKVKSIKHKVRHSIAVSSTAQQHDRSVDLLHRTLRTQFGYTKRVRTHPMFFSDRQMNVWVNLRPWRGSCDRCRSTNNRVTA